MITLARSLNLFYPFFFCPGSESPSDGNDRWQKLEVEKLRRSFGNHPLDTDQQGNISSRSIKESRPILSLTDDSKTTADTDSKKPNTNRKKEKAQQNFKSKIPRKRNSVENTDDESISRTNTRTASEISKEESVVTDSKRKSKDNRARKALSETDLARKSPIDNKQYNSFAVPIHRSTTVTLRPPSEDEDDNESESPPEQAPSTFLQQVSELGSYVKIIF